MNEIIMLLDPADFEALGTVRTVHGLRVAEAGGQIWLRGIPSLEKADRRVRQLPAQKTYLLGKGELLFPLGGQTPEGKLPEVDWKSISAFVEVENPVSAMPGEVRAKLPFRLRRSELARAGEALRIDLAAWKTYADSAPAHRLGALKFAATPEGEVLVMGTPLPAIPGKEYWMQELMLVPCGHELEFPAIAGQVSQRLNPVKDGVVLLHLDGNWEKIGWMDFTAASRSAVRRTANKLLMKNSDEPFA